MRSDEVESKPYIKKETVTKKDYIYMSIIYNTKDGFYKQDDFRVPVDCEPDASRDYFSLIDNSDYVKELEIIKWTDSYTTWDGVRIIEGLFETPTIKEKAHV